MDESFDTVDASCEAMAQENAGCVSPKDLSVCCTDCCSAEDASDRSNTDGKDQEQASTAGKSQPEEQEQRDAESGIDALLIRHRK
jgi:hypothetical protein